jgi:DGQHR domain-containing protein
VLDNVEPIENLRGLATRKSKADEFKSVRNQLVAEEAAGGWVLVKKNKSSSRLSKPKRHDKLLEDRVWTLMYRMGFKNLSGNGGAFLLVNSSDPKGPDNQIDVVAIDDEVTFAIECKSSDRPRKFGDFSSVLAKHVALRDRLIRAVRDQYETPHTRPTVFAIWTSGFELIQNDQKRASEERALLLDETDLNYYEQLVAQIGAAARFQFLADLLQNKPVPGLELTVPAIRSKIGKIRAYTFSVSPEYLLKIAFVSHRAKGKASDIDAYQRLLKKSRLRSIRDYISEGGFFPTNIVVNIAESRWLSFDRGKQEGDEKSTTFGWLTLRPAYRVAWIIDGQHRLFAYANHELAHKSLISVMAFVGLAPSEQARMFVDINAEQRKVKQSLLQELYAELHWDADDPEVRIQAILSKVVQSLDSDLRSPFRARILKADDARSDTRCISLTSVFGALEKGGFFIAKTKKGEVIEFGPLWAIENDATMKRTISVLETYFDAIRSEASELWERGAAEGGGLSMNDGVTVCINVLASILAHLREKKRIDLVDLDSDDLGEIVSLWGRRIGRYFAALSAEKMTQFRALRGVQGQTTGTRRLQEALRAEEPEFDPPGLREFLEREKAQTTTRAYEVIVAIEQILKATILSELRSEFGSREEDWWFTAVPKSVRKKVDDRINEDGGKSGGRSENFDLIDYREIIQQNWQMFETTLAKGKSGNKDAKTKWISEVNELRKHVMHASKGQSLPITEEQLAGLVEIQDWLKGQIGEVK